MNYRDTPGSKRSTRLGELGPAWISAIAALLTAMAAAGFFAGRVTSPPGDTSEAAPSGTSARESVSVPEVAPAKSLMDLPSPSEMRGYEQSSQRVNGSPAERVFSSELICGVSSHTSSQQFQLDRQFRVFRSQVGLTDESEIDEPVKFTVRVDGEDRASTVASLGELKPLDVDVTNGLRVELYVEMDYNCSGSIIAAWVDPMVIR